MIHLLDTTLREGEQTVGIKFSFDQKLAIINGVARIGISEMELGIASPLIDDLEGLLTHCRSNHPFLKTSLWCRCNKADIDYAAKLRPDRLSLSIAVSDLHLSRKLEKDRKWAEQTMTSCIRIARDKGLDVSVGFEDATRAEPRFLSRMASLAEQAGAFRIRLADTVGIASPFDLVACINAVAKSAGDCEIGVHTHNDFGMATANAITALQAGARWVDVSVLGLGERCGCARLEEVVGYLGIMEAKAHLRVDCLKPLAEYVAAITAKRIDESRPIVGEMIFACETGLHLDGLLCDHSTYEPFAPERVGAVRRLVFGAKCGRKAVKRRLSELGYTVDDDLLLAVTRSLRDSVHG